MRKNVLLVMVMLTILACKKEKNSGYQFTENQIQLNYDKTYQLEVKQNNQKIDNLTIDFKSSDENVGSVGMGGLFTAKKVGETVITGKINNKEFSTTVTVKPYSNLCREPFTDFGAPKSSIIAYEKRTKSNESTDYLVYTGENAKTLQVIYGLKDQKLDLVGVVFLPSADVVKESVKFFAERYMPVGQSEDAVFFSDLKKVVIILQDVKSIGYMATYIPYNPDDFKMANIKNLHNKYQTALKRLKAVK